MNKNGYIRKRFDEVFDLQMGKTPDRKTPSFYGGKNVWLSIRDMGPKYLQDSNEHITDEGVSASGIKIVKKGTVVMSFKLTVGKCGIASRDLYTNEAIMAFNIKEGYSIDASFLYYYLQGYHWSGANKAVMGLTLNKATISKHKIAIPSMEEQLAIVAELDEINEAIAALQQQVADLDTLAQSTFYDMFGDPIANEKGWDLKKLGDLSIVKTGPFGSMLHKEDYIENGIPLVNPIHMKNYTVVPDMSFTISERKAAELSNYLLQENDVVFARRGDIGRCAVINKNQKGFLCGTGSLFVRFKDKVESVFIMYVIRSKSFSTALVSSAKGATMLNINSSIVENLYLILPPLALQQEFAAKIEAIESAKAELNAQIAETQNLLASRMDYYFD